ncbi:MAG: AAA family ATPase [Candidatus Latescibacterota bacterium]|nr:AAA family ATPase [Candidatus Latescibacterota bacterium]
MSFRMEKPGLDPEQIRRILTDQETPPADSEAANSETSGSPSGGGGVDEQPLRFEFSLKPEELIAHLDHYVVGQNQAKAILATKICTHFNRLSLPDDDEEDAVGRIKNNVLMIGPTGVGKTFLIRLIAKKLGVPFVKADATKFSETGYVGGDVEDLVRELVAEADGDLEIAQHGIIYIDEIDKIAASGRVSGPDVSRTGVQRNLLKLMEETEVDLRSPHDLSSQMETVMQMQRTGKVDRKKVSTRDILFVVSGAFSGLEEIIRRRLSRGSMGFRLFGEDEPQAVDEASALFRQARSEDLIAYGFESEFIGRLPVMAVLDELGREELLAILRSPKSSIILSKVRDFRAYDIDIEFSDESLQRFADAALLEHTGARGLVSAVERVLLDFECRLPSTSINRFEVTAEVVDHSEECLGNLVMQGSLESFCESFAQNHGVRIHFTDTAAERIVAMAQEQERLPKDLCSELFADYGHGLKLLELANFEVTQEIVDRPQEALNAMIRELYGSRDQPSAP